MEADELAGWLDAAGVPGPVSVRVERDRAWCLRPVPPPEQQTGQETGPLTEVPGQGWEVFWSEDDGRFEWTRFDDEDTACFYLFGRLTWAQALRGRRFG